jgi:putative transferase (TIGR04331 family)
LKKELIKTSLEKSKGAKDDYVYLSDWCEVPKNKKPDIIDYPISADQLLGLNEEINKVSKILLSQLTKTYNKNLRINENEIYYKIILGNWLNHFVSNVYEKIILLKNVKDLHPNISTKIGKSFFEESSNSYSYYVKAFSSHTFHYKFFSSILNINKDFKKIVFDIPEIKLKRKIKKSFFFRIRENLRYYLGEFFLVINKTLKNDYTLVVNPYYSKGYLFNALWFFIKSKGKIIHYDFKKNKSNIKINKELRNKFSFSISKNENLLLHVSAKLLFKYIPICYLEQFIEFRGISRKWHLKNTKCKRFFTANAIQTEEQFKYTVAFNQKIPLSTIQHGNGYGSDKIIPMEDYEISLSENFYTWGWGKLKLPHPKLNFNKKSNYIKKSRILFTLPSMGFYSNLLVTNNLYFMRRENITDDSNQFIKNLSTTLKQNFFKRELRDNFLREMKFESKNKDDSFKNFHKSLYHSRIHVTNHFGTPFLESLSMGIPTILFLNNFEDYLRSDVLNLFKQMESVNIIFDDPISASDHINKYYDSINTWWMRESTQAVLRKFRARFCYSSSNWKEKWLKELTNE